MAHSLGARTLPFRWSHPDDPARILRGRITLPADVARPPYVMLLHGFKGFMDWGFFPELAQRLSRRGIASVAFNTSGSGIGDDLENFTEPEAFARDTVTRQLEDIDRVRSSLRAGFFPELDLARAGIFGHSRGGAAALIHAAEHGDYRALVTWAALANFDPFDEATKGLWRGMGHVLVHNARTGQDLRVELDALDDIERNRERFDLAAACSRLSTPALLIHGSQDEAVDKRALEQLARALPPGVGRALLVEGAGHAFGARHPLTEIPSDLELVLDATTRFFEERLR